MANFTFGLPGRNLFSAKKVKGVESYSECPEDTKVSMRVN
jgi:hypothetical protein